MRKKIVNKMLPVEMFIDTSEGPRIVQGTAIITNDSHGKTLSLTYGSRHMTIAVEQVERYLKD